MTPKEIIDHYINQNKDIILFIGKGHHAEVFMNAGTDFLNTVLMNLPVLIKKYQKEGKLNDN